MYSEVGMYRNEKCNFLKNIWPHYVTQKCAAWQLSKKKQHELTSHATEQGQDILGIS